MGWYRILRSRGRTQKGYWSTNQIMQDGTYFFSNVLPEHRAIHCFTVKSWSQLNVIVFPWAVKRSLAQPSFLCLNLHYWIPPMYNFSFGKEQHFQISLQEPIQTEWPIWIIHTNTGSSIVTYLKYQRGIVGTWKRLWMGQWQANNSPIELTRTGGLARVEEMDGL